MRCSLMDDRHDSPHIFCYLETIKLFFWVKKIRLTFVISTSSGQTKNDISKFALFGLAKLTTSFVFGKPNNNGNHFHGFDLIISFKHSSFKSPINVISIFDKFEFWSEHWHMTRTMWFFFWWTRTIVLQLRFRDYSVNCMSF